MLPSYPWTGSPGLLTGATGVTLFSGLGGSAFALRNLLGVDVTRCFEWIPPDGKGRPNRLQYPAKTLELNGFAVTNEDVKRTDFRPWVGTDIVEGGPPCQPFSQGGRNAGFVDPRDCVPDFIRAVAEILPRLFIMENVRGLAGPRHRDYLETRVKELEALGYLVDYRVLDAADYGVPQSRKRLFVVGIRDDLDGFVVWPEKMPRVTMADALGWTRHETHLRNLLAPEPARVDWSDRRWEWPLERPSTTVVGSFRPDVQACPGFREAGDGPRQNAPGSVVTTLEERLALQGLPRDYALAGSQSSKDLQVGNSVPPQVIALLTVLNYVGSAA